MQLHVNPTGGHDLAQLDLELLLEWSRQLTRVAAERPTTDPTILP